MSRRQLVGFVVVLALIGAGLVLKQRGGHRGPDLAKLRSAAALAPCPSGLGPDLPAVSLPCLGGGPRVDVRGKSSGRPTLVNVWGSWCGPCVEEVPDLVAFTKKAGDRVAVVGVDTEDDPVNALTFAAQHGMHYPSLVDDDKVLLRTAANGPPVTFFLDTDGHVVHTERGRFHSLAQIEQLVAQHLGVTV